MKMHEKVKQVVATILNKEIRREMQGWPPGCAGPLYQPKRPCTPPQASKTQRP